MLKNQTRTLLSEIKIRKSKIKNDDFVTTSFKNSKKKITIFNVFNEKSFFFLNYNKVSRVVRFYQEGELFSIYDSKILHIKNILQLYAIAKRSITLDRLQYHCIAAKQSILYLENEEKVIDYQKIVSHGLLFNQIGEREYQLFSNPFHNN